MTTDLGIPQLRNISNSEVTAFLSCKRMYNFAFMRNLAPKVTPTPLARGSAGHLGFEFYVDARLNGASHDQAMKKGLEAFMPQPGDNVTTIMNAQFLWNRYMQFHGGWPNWTLLGTEQQVNLPLSDTLSFPIRYDLYLEDRSNGKRYILDFKFTFDFWSPEDHDINAQMPKYIAVMKANGFKVDGGYLEETRTRSLGKEKSSDSKNLWRRTSYYPSLARVRNMLQQQVATAMQIERHRNLSEEQRTAESIAVFNKHGACKFCNFKDLCNSMTEGKSDLTVDIRTGYVQNTYGYNKQVMEELL